MCEAIEDREESIEAYSKQVADLKGKDVCQNCKEHLDADVVFCPKCGTKVERKEKEEVEEVIGEVVEESAFEEEVVAEADEIEVEE